ncbi:substrate-binding domain-containing protein [uncultured Roseobacter sp.]|uniref:substrate-binding domain-containing protein n=1 Tax=uncultured Roseobacter sp. TaxID=114847 RepID=UPI00345D10EB
MLEKQPTLTGFLCLLDLRAQGVLSGLRHMGISVPADMSIIGIDDLHGSASTCPPLTSVGLPVAKMGHQAARALEEWIEEGDPHAP